jgi:myo-inositol-1-phosphate synthase
MAGVAAARRGIAPLAGLVTQRPEFAASDLAAPEAFVFGGHEVRAGALPAIAKTVLESCRVPYLADAVREDLAAFDRNIRPGIVRGAGETVASMADAAAPFDTDAAAMARIRADLDAFKAAEGLDALVVVNVASTEPPMDPQPSWNDLDALEAAAGGTAPVLPASALYAWAALSGGDAYVNFTPSVGSDVPALRALAEARGAVHMGKDGKTGETLVKSVLGELFARRNLRVLSWFGQNILGNDDGRVLENPSNKASKIRTKDHLLRRILGYAPETRVGIDFVESLGEWKIAWDHIHFSGFLGGRMQMQFTWDGCDSLLAAPLVIDLVRLTEFAHRRGERGLVTALSSFFKDPMGTEEQRLVRQDEDLLAWMRRKP